MYVVHEMFIFNHTNLNKKLYNNVCMSFQNCQHKVCTLSSGIIPLSLDPTILFDFTLSYFMSTRNMYLQATNLHCDAWNVHDFIIYTDKEQHFA